jgi:sulfate permease, SulP family
MPVLPAGRLGAMSTHRPQRLLPFLRWWPMRADTLRADVVAGISVALVLVPQSMAYAQLAGMPAYYGLYAAFLPVIVAALWGSSNQLATGPAAVSSILTASALAPLAALGSEAFVTLAIVLAFMVGVIQLLLGLSRLGKVVSFLSHPVIVGFTSAAAIIIGLSQLNKLLGLPIGRSQMFLADIWEMLRQLPDLHLASVAIGAAAMAIIWGFKRWLPKWPGVLVAVALTTSVSWWIEFERRAEAPLAALADSDARSLAQQFETVKTRIAALDKEIAALGAARAQAPADQSRMQSALLRHELELKRLERTDLARENGLRLRDLRSLDFVLEPAASSGPDGAPGALTLRPAQDASGSGARWRVRDVRAGMLQLSGGGEVVGFIPPGLPAFAAPAFSWDAVRSLLSAALVIALVGFVEAISIAKAIAAKTRQRIDANQELIGQGLGNLAGSFTQAFPTMGSFSRSAVNFSVGAKSGFACVVTGVLIMITLLALTPLLYHLPQAVLAAIIMMAVVNLIDFKAMHHAWVAHRHDGIAAWATFAATLLLAPALDYGVLVGAGLAIGLYLYRTMQPRVALLGRHPDGTLRDARVHRLATSEHLAVLRYDGSLYFANVPYFEDMVLEALASQPSLREILVVGDGLNSIDASGVDVIEQLIDRLRSAGVTLSWCALKLQITDVFDRTGLTLHIGPEHFFRTEDQAIEAIARRLGEPQIAERLLVPAPRMTPR